MWEDKGESTSRPLYAQLRFSNEYSDQGLEISASGLRIVCKDK